MMGTKMLKHLRDAISNLNPQDVRNEANRAVSIDLHAQNSNMYWEMERLLMPSGASTARRDEMYDVVHRAGESGARPGALAIYQEGLPHPAGAFIYRPDAPSSVIEDILEAHPDLSLALARKIPPFRRPVVDRTIKTVSKENALFSIATAIPAAAPLVAIPWAVGEFASDTAFITMNQIRMGFLIAAASDRKVGYRDQRTEIASLFAGAFGWRSLARELVSKIPFGGGIIPKAAVSYAGTYVVGLSLDRFYRLGYGYTRAERQAAYGEAFERGKTIATSLLQTLKGKPSSAGASYARR